MSGLIWIQTVWHSDGIPERFFFFKLKKIHRQQKNMQIYPECKELRVNKEVSCSQYTEHKYACQ